MLDTSKAGRPPLSVEAVFAQRAENGTTPMTLDRRIVREVSGIHDRGRAALFAGKIHHPSRAPGLARVIARDRTVRIDVLIDWLALWLPLRIKTNGHISPPSLCSCISYLPQPIGVTKPHGSKGYP